MIDRVCIFHCILEKKMRLGEAHTYCGTLSISPYYPWQGTEYYLKCMHLLEVPKERCEW